MSISVDRVITNRPYLRKHDIAIPEYNSIVTEFRVKEGKSGFQGSMNNILFDSKEVAVLGATLTTNDEFAGTYSSGVAPDWTVDGGVTATETTNLAGTAPAQRVTNMNGVSQGLQGTGLTGLTVGNIYVVNIIAERVSGTGNMQIQLDGFGGMSGTYDANNSVFPTSITNNIRFYLVAESTTSTVTLTADDTGLVFDVELFTVQEVEGGDHMVMPFDLYDESNRGEDYYDLNGVDQYFYIHDDRQSGLSFGSDAFSIASIVYPDGYNARMFTKWDSANQRSVDWRIASAKDLRLFISEDGSTFTDFIDGDTVINTLSQYYFVACEFSAGVGSINLNGVNETVTYASGPPLTSDECFASTAPAAIGCIFSSGSPAQFMDGRIGKMIIWKGVSLSESQFNTVFNLLRGPYGI
jgi:hypothetical protein